MISDIKDFLNSSEANTERLYSEELKSIFQLVRVNEFSGEFEEQMEEIAEYRFKKILALRIRYSTVVALTTSVEWSIMILNNKLKEHLMITPTKRNRDGKEVSDKKPIIYYLRKLCKLTGIKSSNAIINDYQAIIYIRNCIVHNAGLKNGYKYKLSEIDRLKGFYFSDVQVFLGEQIFIEKDALNVYIDAISELILELQKECHEQGFTK
jgi:hypothetical protein